ncbi:MAG: ATP-dependent Clp protease adaptor ClpS [Desulfovibrionaceae bacterium]|nr:ATP-dependent Clp protease adaptor ClpS [Desulfovibrionaceae bacterium]
MSDEIFSPGTEATDLIEPELKEPPRFAVYLHNDDYTSMEFVVQILKEIFFKKEEEAVALMLRVHQEGIAKCGTYIKEVAETKLLQVSKRAREAGFPLLCTMEQE